MKPLNNISDIASHDDLCIGGAIMSASIHGTNKVAIIIGGSIPTDDLIKSPRVSNAIRAALDSIAGAIIIAAAENSPENQRQAASRQQSLLGCFGSERIHAKQIPNGYWGKDHPVGVLDHWFEVTTRLGRFVIGWRKRVISIDWTATDSTTPKASDIFADEDVTKGEKSIHAWSAVDATRYIAAIHENSKPTI